ncbi:hypothetical protein [Mucilaginibacter terrae]|uniref:Uncharacterized protein n=1 Tax=Mucilaginibacter terrae TaxID=1955052 RepID=A0ABU3H0H3_9SPHI|nr:hypothetical protein [Mucilaginibacter terrae]MDT3405514.1 hypothetical protein [Mucilaginibacter terrae]
MRTILLALCILGVTLTSHAQSLFGKTWIDGYYYDLTGKKVTGLISWSAPQKSLFSTEGDRIFFKEKEDAQKVKLLSKQISGFVMDKDSFVVSKHIDLKDFSFLSVVLNTPTKLYLSTIAYSAITSNGMVSGGVLKNYYYGPDPDNITKITRKNYIDVLSQLMADKPDVVAKIKDKKFRFGRIDDLVEYYQTGVIPKTILFWPKTKDGKADDMY